MQTEELLREMAFSAMKLRRTGSAHIILEGKMAVFDGVLFCI